MARLIRLREILLADPALGRRTVTYDEISIGLSILYIMARGGLI